MIGRPGNADRSVSVVIPALNEAAALPAILDRLAEHAPGAEVVVVDAGSQDDTVSIARAHPSRPVMIRPGGLLTRGAAQNAGAAAATGEIFWFLHADTHPRAGQVERLRAALGNPRVVGGAFEFGFRERARDLAVVTLANRVRYRIRPRYYGDQGIFARRTAFEAVGGFAGYALMEDAHLCRDLGRRGRLVLIRSILPTSARRFLAGGVLRVLWFDVRVWLTDMTGGDVQRFAARYRAENLARATAVTSRTSPPGRRRSGSNRP